MLSLIPMALNAVARLGRGALTLLSLLKGLRGTLFELKFFPVFSILYGPGGPLSARLNIIVSLRLDSGSIMLIFNIS